MASSATRWNVGDDAAKTKVMDRMLAIIDDEDENTRNKIMATNTLLNADRVNLEAKRVRLEAKRVKIEAERNALLRKAIDDVPYSEIREDDPDIEPPPTIAGGEAAAQAGMHEQPRSLQPPSAG